MLRSSFSRTILRRFLSIEPSLEEILNPSSSPSHATSTAATSATTTSKSNPHNPHDPNGNPLPRKVREAVQRILQQQKNVRKLPPLPDLMSEDDLEQPIKAEVNFTTIEELIEKKQNAHASMPELLNWCDQPDELVRVIRILKKLPVTDEPWAFSDELLSLAVRAGAPALAIDMLKRQHVWRMKPSLKCTFVTIDLIAAKTQWDILQETATMLAVRGYHLSSRSTVLRMLKAGASCGKLNDSLNGLRDLSEFQTTLTSSVLPVFHPTAETRQYQICSTLPSPQACKQALSSVYFLKDISQDILSRFDFGEHIFLEKDRMLFDQGETDKDGVFYTVLSGSLQLSAVSNNGSLPSKVVNALDSLGTASLLHDFIRTQRCVALEDSYLVRWRVSKIEERLHTRVADVLSRCTDINRKCIGIFAA